MNRRAAVSIAELLADGVPVHPSEAVAIVRRVCASVDEHPPRVSHASDIVLLADAKLVIGTGRSRHQPVTLLLAALLQSLLDRSPLGHRPSPALSDVVASGLGLLGPTKFRSADAFADALHQFEGPDPEADLRALFARWRAVCDLANDLPEAVQTVQLVLRDATGNARPSVVVRKPDRRRYARVVFRADAVKVALVTNLSGPETEGSDASAAADEPGRVRDLAIASVLLLFMVPTGLWFGGALTHLVRHEPRPLTAVNGPTAVEPAMTATGPALTAVAPLDLIAVQPDPGVAGSDFSLRPGLPSAVRAEPISLRDTPAVDSAPKTKSPTGGAQKTSNVQLSPDGKRVAFDSNRRGTRAVYVADRDGKNLRRVSGVGVAERPIWSPNSRRLAFMRAGRNGVWNLWTVELENGVLRQVSFDGSGRPSGASWFPNSKRIGYSHGTELRVVDVKNGKTLRFAAPRHGRIGASAVSPDGRRIVFRAGASATWLLDLSNDGPEQMRRILTDASARAFSWAPDGKQLAYFSRRKGDWIVIQEVGLRR